MSPMTGCDPGLPSAGREPLLASTQRRRRRQGVAAALFSLPWMLGAAAAPAAGLARDLYGAELGTVAVPAGCSRAAQPALRRGMALLHHMTYNGALAEFRQAADADPGCALALWGQAMTLIHPLWSDPPDQEEFQQAQQLLEQAGALAGSPAERAYVDAHATYFQPGRSKSEKPNLSAWAEGWQRAHEQFPSDPEIRSFLALAVLATADPDDKSYRVQQRSAAIARPVLDQLPAHPGGHHYLIHAHDYPPLARAALEVARSYGAIAPTVPHALHMPSHLFIRVGLWDEAIAMNRRSADAALLHPVQGMVSLHYPHALDYLIYAHLQRGEDAQALAVLSELSGRSGTIQPHIAAAYALAAMPARLSLERGDWQTAARTVPAGPTAFPWERFPAMRAITVFARSLGAARAGDPDTARRELQELAELRAQALAASPYWGKQVLIMETTAQAWLDYAAGGRTDQGLARMREAAELERSTDKHPVTPGEVLPAMELLGEMLLLEERHAEALQAFRDALERSPGRHNSLYGAGRAAEALGQTAEAADLYRALVNGTNPQADTRAVQHARRYLEKTSDSMPAHKPSVAREARSESLSARPDS